MLLKGPFATGSRIRPPPNTNLQQHKCWAPRLWLLLQVLTALSDLDSSGTRAAYFVHADDDSFVRLDLLLPLLVGGPCQESCVGRLQDVHSAAPSWLDEEASDGLQVVSEAFVPVSSQGGPAFKHHRPHRLTQTKPWGSQIRRFPFQRTAHIPPGPAGVKPQGEVLLGLHLGWHRQPCNGPHPQPAQQVTHAASTGGGWLKMPCMCQEQLPQG